MIRILVLLFVAACGYTPSLETTALCGDDAAIIDSSVAADVAPAPRALTAFKGQSNAVGAALSSALPPELAAPFEGVRLDSITGQNATSDPPAWTTYGGPLAPRYLKFGAEITYGRAVDGDIAICAINGASLAEHLNPYGTWPSNGPNAYQRCVDFLHGLEAAHGVRLEWIIWEQGESDINPIEEAQAYGANLTQLAQLLLAEFPCARFVYNRLHSSGNGATLGYYAATVRAGQDAASTGDWMTMVNADALAMSGQHFTAQGYQDLGNLFATTISGLTPRCQ